MRTPEPDVFESRGKIGRGENSFLEPGEFRGNQTIILDAGISRYLHPRWVPGAKHAGFMLPAEEAAVPFHRKFRDGVRLTRRHHDSRLGCRRVGKTICPFSHKAMKFACFRSMSI